MQNDGRADAFMARSTISQLSAAGIATHRCSKECCSGANQPASSATNMITALKNCRSFTTRAVLLMLGAAIETPSKGFGGQTGVSMLPQLSLVALSPALGGNFSPHWYDGWRNAGCDFADMVRPGDERGSDFTLIV